MRVPLSRWMPLVLACMLLEILTRISRQLMLSNYVSSRTRNDGVYPQTTSDDDSKPTTTKNVPFTGTIITRHAGVDMYENVCIATELTNELDENSQRMRRHFISSYTLEGTSIGYRPVPWTEWADIVTITKGKPLQDWEKDSKELLIEEETLLMLDLFGNPAHCLADQLYSIALDIISRRGLQRTGKEHTFYPTYFRAQWSELPDECPQDNWCCHFMKMLGIISNRPTPPPPEFQPICFRRLVVPRHGALRFPAEEPLMQKVLEKIQTMALEATHLRADPWKKEEIAKKAPILFYDRRGTGRRILENSARIKQLIEAKYHANVLLMGREWNTVTDQHNVTAQALVYNSFPYIITSHGAHLTNLLFARKDTRVMEIMCWIPGHPDPHGDLFLNLTNKHQANKVDDWYGEPSPLDDTRWFYSFSRKLGVEHFVYSEHDGCIEDGKLEGVPKKITVDEMRFVSFVGNRFKLQPRLGRGGVKKLAEYYRNS